MRDLHPLLLPTNRREDRDGEDRLQCVPRRRMLATWVVDYGEKINIWSIVVRWAMELS